MLRLSSPSMDGCENYTRGFALQSGAPALLRGRRGPFRPHAAVRRMLGRAPSAEDAGKARSPPGNRHRLRPQEMDASACVACHQNPSARRESKRREFGVSDEPDCDGHGSVDLRYRERVFRSPVTAARKPVTRPPSLSPSAAFQSLLP